MTQLPSWTFEVEPDVGQYVAYVMREGASWVNWRNCHYTRRGNEGVHHTADSARRCAQREARRRDLVDERKQD